MLKQKFLIDFGSKFFIQFLTAIVGIIVARVAGPEVVGTIAFATAYVSIFTFIPAVLSTSHIKSVSEGNEESESNGTYLIIQLMAIFVYLIVVVAYYFIQKHFLNYKFENEITEIVVWITLIGAVFGQFYVMGETFFIAKTEQIKANMPNIVRIVVYNIFRFLVIIFGYGAIALALGNLLSLIIVFPLLYWYLKKLRFGNFNSKLAIKYLKISLPILSIVVIQSVLTYSDKLILEKYADLTSIGLYSAAFSIGGLFIMIGRSSGTVFFPLFSNYIAKNDWEQVKQKVKTFERFIFSFVFTIMVSFAIFSLPIMLTLLGDRYYNSAPLLSVLIISSFFIIAGMPYGNILSGMGLFWLSSRLYFFQLIVFLVVLIVSIHPKLLNMGTMALAITQLAINLFLYFTFIIASFRKTGIAFFKTHLSFYFYWIVVFFSCKYFEIETMTISNIYQSFLILPLFILTNIFILNRLKMIKNEDFKLILKLINPKDALNYIKKEIK